MNDKLSEHQLDSILKALDEAIEKGPWDESNFLRLVAKNLREIRDDFSKELMSIGQEKTKIASHLLNRVALRAGQQEVFVSLYSSEGSVLQSWEPIVANLPKQMVSRPIYADEEDIKALIKTKEKKNNEAYVSMYIAQSDILILPSDRTPMDKLGKSLLILKDKSLSLDNINRFVHQSGVYRYVNGKLIKNLIPE
jgi:intracellular multiplication protein IcmQ